MNAKYSRLREPNTEGDVNRNLLQRLFEIEKPVVKMLSVSHEGDATFSVDLKQFGLKIKDFGQDRIYESSFFVNFLGEYLVRKNMDIFANLITDLPFTDYENVVCGYTHSDFGVVYQDDNTLHFTMHLSLVQNIMTEELKKIVP